MAPLHAPHSVRNSECINWVNFQSLYCANKCNLASPDSRLHLVMKCQVPDSYMTQPHGVHCKCPGDALHFIGVISDMSVKWKHIIQTLQYFVLINQELPWKYVYNNIFFKHDIENHRACIKAQFKFHLSHSFFYNLTLPRICLTLSSHISLIQACNISLNTFFPSRVKLFVSGISPPILINLQR